MTDLVEATVVDVDLSLEAAEVECAGFDGTCPNAAVWMTANLPCRYTAPLCSSCSDIVIRFNYVDEFVACCDCWRRIEGGEIVGRCR